MDICVTGASSGSFFLWVPEAVFSAGKGVSSVDAWYATTIDIEEVLSNARQGDVHIFVADVVKWIVPWVDWGFRTVGKSGFGSNLSLGWELPGHGTGIPRGDPRQHGVYCRTLGIPHLDK